MLRIEIKFDIRGKISLWHIITDMEVEVIME